jgi:hypothetical protein
MRDSLQPYRAAMVKYVYAICIDRNLDPDSTVDIKVDCRIKRFLPELVRLAQIFHELREIGKFGL